MADSILIVGLGFTGKLVLQYLSTHPERHTFTLQAGGRSPSKILATIADVGAASDDVKIVVFDLSNYDDVEKAVLGATVVINCAGPFYRYGSNVVKACARHGKHYVDISGETHWQADMIDKYDFVAWKTGATIVPACCFDSIPSDLSVYTSVQTLKAIVGPDAKVANSTSVFKMKGTMSGGTAATIMTMFDEVTPSELKRGSRPYALSPVKGRPVPYPRLIYTLPEITSKPIVGGFFLMGGSNSNVVRRTWGLLQSLPSTAEDKKFAYGDAFDYDEFMQTPSKISALLLSLTIFVGAGLAMTLSPFRWFMKTFVMPKTGTGPSPDSFTKSRFEVLNVATSVPSASSPRPRTVRTVFRGHGDPGYYLGSRMVSEGAIALLPSNRSKLTALGRAGGLLTPMSAFGNTITERLVATGKFDIVSEELMDGGASESKKAV